MDDYRDGGVDEDDIEGVGRIYDGWWVRMFPSELERVRRKPES